MGAISFQHKRQYFGFFTIKLIPVATQLLLQKRIWGFFCLDSCLCKYQISDSAFLDSFQSPERQISAVPFAQYFPSVRASSDIRLPCLWNKFKQKNQRDENCKKLKSLKGILQSQFVTRDAHMQNETILRCPSGCMELGLDISNKDHYSPHKINCIALELD